MAQVLGNGTGDGDSDGGKPTFRASRGMPTPRFCATGLLAFAMVSGGWPLHAPPASETTSAHSYTSKKTWTSAPDATVQATTTVAGDEFRYMDMIVHTSCDGTSRAARWNSRGI